MHYPYFDRDLPEFDTILPAKVRYDKRLKPMEKIIYSEIMFLIKEKGYCSKPNSYFINLYDIGKSSITSYIRNLAYYGYLRVEIICEEHTKKIIERKIFLNK